MSSANMNASNSAAHTLTDASRCTAKTVIGRAGRRYQRIGYCRKRQAKGHTRGRR
ncbi:MAG: hypothetical protein WA125_17525 [Desulfosporosinus sp.]